MALIKSLEICGIRNFSPDIKQIVTFSTPVVLFQGANGSGKTTILEAIRYALTGELPGGTNSGHGFVNEPKMSNKNSTKGSIKIKFNDAEGNLITVVRVVQVQLTPKGGLQFKKLNYSVRIRDKDDADKVRDISGRCADIDSYCCTTLNVSKSIFNNVLFCHQENSLWPLDESKKLKEKFDEIFDAVRYNKCIDTMRKLIKEKQGDLKVLEERLTSRKAMKVQVDRQRAKFEDKKDKLKDVTELIERKNNELKPLKKRMREILDLEDSLGSLQRQLSGEKEKKKGLVNQQETIGRDISYIFEGSDEELRAKIESFKDKQSAEESTIRQLEKSVQDVNKQISSINTTTQSKQVKIGQMKEEQNQYQKKLEENRELIEKLRTQLDVEDFGDKDILLGELANALKSQQKKFDELKNERDAEENELQCQIDKLREGNAKTEQLVASKDISVREYQKKQKDIQYKLEELDTSHSQLKNVTDKIEQLQTTLANLNNSFNMNQKVEEIQELKETIGSKEQYLEKLDRENRVLQRNYATEQKIESEKSSIIEKQGLINKIKTKHSENLKKLFDDDVPVKNLKKSVLQIQIKSEAEFRTRTTSINTLERSLATLESSLNHLRDRLKTSQQELSTNKRKVLALCKGKEFSAVLKDTYQKKETLQKRKGHYTAAKIMYESFIGGLESNKCCPVCNTNFDNNRSAIPDIIKVLKHKVSEVPSNVIEVEAELKKEEAFYDDLQRLKAVNDDIERLTNDKIPEFEKEIGKLIEESEDKTMELAGEKNSVEKPQRLIEICKNVITDATLFDQYQIDIDKATVSVEDLEENIEKVASNRSRQETEMEIDSVKGELSNLKNRYETNKNQLELQRDRCQDINKKIQAAVQRQIDIQKLVQEKPLLEIQNTECGEKLVVLAAEIEELTLSLSTQKIELRDATENKTKVAKINAKIKDTARNTLLSYQNALSDIRKLQKTINDYERNKSNEKLEQAITELAELKVNLQNLEKNKGDALESVTKRKEAIAKKESEFRALTDNVTLRKIQKQEDLVATEIVRLEEKIGGYNYRQVFEEKEKKTAEIDKKTREINNFTGQLEEIQAQADELEGELQKPELKNAYNNYKIAYYQHILNLYAVEDLKRYVIVLERCVLKFHEERMIQINRMIKSLWRTIYRGNDIDHIEIKTDENTSTVGAGNRRSYNYKVVQVKNSIELDMRGRCSAGQKVLACLVIRMALAETFSSHCGILALDEPTTNLDKQNISSLSDALSELINRRETQSNFQLLVITHDEEFLRSLTQVQSIESYWQVKRNAQGSSTVEKQML